MTAYNISCHLHTGDERALRTTLGHRVTFVYLCVLLPACRNTFKVLYVMCWTNEKRMHSIELRYKIALDPSRSSKISDRFDQQHNDRSPTSTADPCVATKSRTLRLETARGFTAINKRYVGFLLHGLLIMSYTCFGREVAPRKSPSTYENRLIGTSGYQHVPPDWCISGRYMN